MKRYLSLSLLVVSLAALASADEPASPPAGPGRILQAQRNESLVHKLIEGGLHLAQANDRLSRAQYCNDLAKSLAEEIRRAADDHDGERTVELARHLQEVLQSGVATNLNKERSLVPRGSARETEMSAVRTQSNNITAPLLKELDQILKDNPPALEQVFQAIQEAQAEVTATGKGR